MAYPDFFNNETQQAQNALLNSKIYHLNVPVLALLATMDKVSMFQQKFVYQPALAICGEDCKDLFMERTVKEVLEGFPHSLTYMGGTVDHNINKNFGILTADNGTLQSDSKYL